MNSPNGTGPHVRVFRFVQDQETSIFKRMAGGPEFDKVPSELVVEDIRHPETIKAETFLRSREREAGRYKLQTGLRQVSSRLFYGDHFEVRDGKSKNSFLLVEFSLELKEFTLHYFNNFKLYPRSRAKFISNYLGKRRQ